MAEISAISVLSCAPRRPRVRYSTVGAGNHDSADESGGNQQPAGIDTHHHQGGNDHEGDVAANHIDLAVGEVDHADNAVHHGIADGNQRIGASSVTPLNICCRK